MERSFERRKLELESECVLPEGVMRAALKRLDAFIEPFLVTFRRHEQLMHATTAVRGLCSDLEHKNCESIAYMFGLDRKSIQHFVGGSKWDDRPIRAELARQVGAQLGERDGVLAFDPSAFAKSGKQSVGVARQWCGRLGKIDNCQVGIYLAYVSSKGHTLVDAELYIPKEWTADRTRMRRAGIPRDRQRHRTRHEICLELLDRHGDTLPHSWVTGDDEMGRPAEFRRELRDRNERYLLAVPSNTTVRDLEVPEPEYCGNGRPAKRPSLRADKWVAECGDHTWEQIEVRDGEKGPLTVHATKRLVETGKRSRSSVATEVLVVIQYRDRDSNVRKTDYYLSNADSQTSLSEFCRAAKAEHRIEECLQRAKGQAGLADYEVRNWVGWHHHQTLSLLASWFLNVETRRAEKKDTGNHLQSAQARHRMHPSHGTEMRFTPRYQLAHRTKTEAKSIGEVLSLETT